MKLKPHTDAVLKRDALKRRLKCGEIVKLAGRHSAPDGSRGYSIEVFNARSPAAA